MKAIMKTAMNEMTRYNKAGGHKFLRPLIVIYSIL